MSRSKPHRRRPSLLLIALCLALGWRVWVELGAGPYEIVGIAGAPTSTSAAPAAVAPVETVAALPLIDNFAETVTRPLFMPTRRPPEPEEEVVEATAPTVGRNLFSLLGIVISADERIALVTRRRTGEMLRLVVGQHIDGWRVETIRSDRITLRQGDETEVIKLTDAQRPKRRKKRAAQQQQEPAATEKAADEETEDGNESQ